MAFDENNNVPVDESNKDSRRNSADLLPMFFRTETNKKFLGATLDTLISNGNLERLNGFIGERDVRNATVTDTYLNEPTEKRKRYNLLPSAIRSDAYTGKNTWSGTYDDLLNQIEFYGGKTNNHDRLFESEYYAWNPLFDFDKFVNYRQYYWLPYGPAPVSVSGSPGGDISQFTVTNKETGAYVFTPNGYTENPTLVLYRGATYKFNINAPGHPFNIKTALTTGIGDRYSSGVENNGDDNGTVTFTVPVNAPDQLYYSCSNHQTMQGRFEIRNTSDDLSINVTEEIIGKATYTSKNKITLTNGMKINFVGDVTPTTYRNANFYVEGVGDEIRLIPEQELVTPEGYAQNAEYEFDIDPFDDTPYDDVANAPLAPDYITINRGAQDRNPWSRYNRWIHKDVIEQGAKYNGTVAVLDENFRATRPILEFNSDLQLYNFGVKHTYNIDLIDTITTDAMSEVEGSIGYYVDSVHLENNMLVSFTADRDITVNSKIFKVQFVEHNGVSRIHLEEIYTPVAGDSILVKSGTKEQGTSWFVKDKALIKGQVKTDRNVSPKFELYDTSGVAFSDETTYVSTTFTGNEIASYNTGTGSNDTVLGFPIAYQNINNVGDIQFNFNWDSNSFDYELNGFFTTVDTASGLIKKNYSDGTHKFLSGWQLVDNKTTRQRVKQIKDTNVDISEINIDCIDNAYKWNIDVVVEYGDNILKNNNGFIVEVNQLKKTYKLIFDKPIPAGTRFVIKVLTDQPANANGFYEPPINLTNNSENNDLNFFTLGSVTDHFRTIFEDNSNITGVANGANNSRDIPNIFVNGSRYVKHKGSIFPAMIHLIEGEAGLINAVRKNARDYNNFKEQFLTIGLQRSQGTNNVREDVDNILYELGVSKTPENSYYYADMAGYGRKKTVKEYTVKTITQNVFGIDNSFDITKIQDRAVYVYLNEEHLTYNNDYVFDAVDNIVTVKRTLAEGDKVTIIDYDTVGNVIPVTPTKLGLYPKYQPIRYTDDTYLESVEVIQGHDGSITRVYGDYRDDLLIELEKRIYNNIKVDYNKTVFDINKHIPGQYRNNNYTRQEFDSVLRKDFSYWKHTYDVDYETNDTADDSVSWSYNFGSFVDQDGTLLPGHWKGIYKLYFDTYRPHSHPWEMLGMSVKPTWWEDTYGPAPYTSGNKILWGDLENGTIKDPSNKRTDPIYARPGLSNNLPVDEYGDLVEPTKINIVKNLQITQVKTPWKFGDSGPAENSWRVSSWYPYAMQIAMALTVPARYFGSLFDTSQNTVAASGNIVYKTTGKIPSLKDYRIDGLLYNNIRFKGLGYHSFISDYEKGQGLNVQDRYLDFLQNTSMNIAYKLGGFANKNRLRVLAESSNPNAVDNSIFLPSENYQLMLRKSNPIDSVRISGIIVEKKSDGFVVRGYDKFEPHFKILAGIRGNNDPVERIGGKTAKFVIWQDGKFFGTGQIVEYAGNYYRTKISHTSSAEFENEKFQVLPELPISGGAEVERFTRFESRVTEIPYGTKFARVQQVYDVILGYGEYLKSQGFVFDKFQKDSKQVQNWRLSGQEFLFWTTQNFNEDSVIALSPFADELSYNYRPGVVDNVLNSFYEYSLLSQDANSLPKDVLTTSRSGGKFVLKTKDSQLGIFFAVLNVVQYEHIIVFDDRSNFGDIIYDQEAGYRQRRIKLIGFKTADWDGDYVSPGFIYDEATITDWIAKKDYNLGDVVRFKNRYYSAKRFLPGEPTFIFDDWLFIGNKPVAELLPNLNYKAVSYEDFYSLENENFDNEASKLAQHLIGYQKRLYLDNLIKDEVSQYKFYQGFIKQKGTTSALNAIQRLNIDGVLNDISLQENWAFKIGSLGSNSTIKEIELPLQETLNVENPQSFEFVSNRLTEQTSSNVIKVLPQDLSVKPSDYNNNPWPQYDITQDGTSLSNVMKLPYAGYSRIEDVTLTLFSKDSLITDTSVPLLDVDDSIWIANDDNGTWAIYRVSANKARLIQTDEVKVSASNNQLTLHTDIPHGLAVNDVISIKDFDSQINGVHRVLEVDDLTTFKIPTTLTTVALSEDSATGSILQFDNVRVGSINDINDVKNIGVLNAGNKIFVDETGSGWAIYEKQSIFEEYNFGSISQEDSIQYGSSIAFGDQGRLIVVGAPNFIDEGSINIIRRKTNVDTATLEQVQGYTISENTSDNLAGGAKPGFGTSVAVSSDGTFIVGGAPNASYVKETNNPEKDARFIEAKINSPASNRLNQGIIKISKLNTTNGEYEPEYVLASQVPTANELFGQQVLVSNERIIVSAPGADSKKGKLYVYDRQVQSDGSTVDWDIPNDQKEIILPNAVAGDQFGQSMAGSKDLEYIVVGIPGREESADLDSTLNSGAVAIYRWNGQQYELLQEINVNTLLRNELKGFDQFGTSVDISDDGKVIIVGAPFSDSVYSNQGKAYIFEMDTTDSTVGIYALGQVITSPVASGGERFGSNVAINPAGTSFAVQGIAGASRVEIPMIDGTTFDSGSMKIVKTQAGSGAVYTYSKLGTKFVFGQNVSSSVLQSNDGFGNGLAYSETSLFIGAPAAVGYKTARTGSLFVYSKNGTAGWNRIREQDSLTNPFSVEKAFTYRTDEQRVIDFLETFDPIKGKIPYLADAEIKFKSTKDPATYTFSNLSTVHVDEGTHWTDLHVGDLWWDLSSVRYLWYEQGDIEYRTNNWGATFPGSSIDIYEWVSTDLTPAEWNEIADTNEGISLGFSGTTKYDENTYTIKRIYDSKTGTFTSRYYYWVRNSAIIPLENQTRKLPASEVARIIENPRAYGIKTLQLLDTNSFSITNIKTTLSDNDVSLSVQYRNVDTDIPQHNEWLIISPDQDAKIDNELLIKKMIDSLVGFDTDGNAVPDPLLPPQKKYGLQIRPRQTIFVNKQDALKVLIGYVNDLCAKNRIADLKDITRLNDSDPLPNTASGRFDISVDENADLQEIKTQDLIQAKVTANITNGRIKSVNIVEKGFGYKIAPEILISGEGYGAKLKSTINSSGQVTNVEVLKEGRNYTRGILTIRPFKVLVTTDETVGNSWTMYEWNNTEWIRTNTQIYNVRSFWEYKDYVITGFSTDEIIDFKITAPYELKTINPDTGNLIEIANGGDNNKMILRKVESNGTFNDDYDLMYKQNATIKFKDSIFNYARDSFGYAGDENYDTNLFDQQPNDETRIIFNTIKDYIFVDDLKYAWNELFFIALRYSISEQGFLDWAFKTSLINVRNNLGGFSRKVNYNIADPGYLEEYVKEIKPYSSTIKEYVVGYDQLEKSSIGTTDFDLPSYYDDNEQKFKVVGLTDSKITEQPYINWFNNYKFNVARISISDPGEGYTQTPIIIVSGGRESKPIITETAPYDNVVDTDYDNIYVYVASSGIPNHFYNTTGVETQSFVFQIPRLSTVDTENKIPTPLGSIGVARNGVPFYNAVAVETQRLGGTEYTLNSVFSQIENGVEDGSGRLGLDGVYNYHADPKLMYEKDPTVHSPILGFAFDGHPIYGPYGYTNSNDKTIKIQTSSYKLRSISRADGSTPDGRYIEDFEYVNGSGDLDEYNGRFIVTPEYPNGTYAYFVTVDPADTTKPVYPYIIGSEYHGTPILPNGNASMPDSDNIPAQAEALISRSSVGSIVLTNPGAGYTKAPTITITGGGGTVTRTAKATAILENNRIRTSKTDLKFDRLQSKKTIQTEQASDTFTSTAGQLKYKLTFLPTLDKRQFTIDINNETLYIENFDIQIVDVPNKTYAKKEGYVVFKTPASTKSTVVIKYKKNIELMHAVDRINYYYSPTEGMPGKDPAQLMSGIEFPGVEVQGLDFGVSVGFDGLPWFSHGWDTFSGNNTDYAFRADGSTQAFTLPYVPENNVKLNVYFDGVRQDPTNTPTITADGNTDTFTLNTTPQDGVLVVFRQQDSDGSTIPTDVNNLDTIIQGGTFAYNTATGQRPEDISLDGDGFVTPDTSHAPEEVLPGQCFDTLSLQIYNAPADGSPIIETTRYFGDGTTRTYNFNRLPGTEDSIFVTVAGTYYTRTDDVSVTNRYSVNYNTKTITFPEEESAPNDGDMVTIQTLNVSGSNILERKQYTGDGSTTEFLLTSRYGDVKSVFATVNGVSKDYVLREDAGTGSTIVDLVNPPVESNAVIQLTGLSGVEKTFSEIKTDIFTTDGSTTEFALTQTPDKIEPFHAMAVVEIDGKRLRAPDTVYYVSNGITLDYLVSQDPSYPAFSLALGELEVHQNGVRLVPIADYQFNTATNLLTFYSGSLKSGDVIAITILRNHDYEIRKENDDDSTGAGKLIIRSNAFGDSTSIDGVVGSEIRITTFTNHDSNLMRKEVFTGNLGGNYTMSRKTVDSNYVWVELNGNPLVADIDYKVLDDGITVYIDNRLSQTETDIVVITSFQENISHDSVGYKVFKDMLNRSHFKRLSLQDTTKLSAILNLTDTEIKVVDASFLPDPDVAQRIPGVIFIGQERIEYYKKDGNTLKQITRGTLGTSTKDTYSVGTRVDDQGQTQTIPYKETTNVFEVIVRDGLPNGKKIHILETMNFATGVNAHDQVEVYVAGRKLQKPTVSSNGITKHDPEIAYDSDELNSLGVASDVTQVPEFTIEPVEDSDVKAYYKLTLRDEPENGMEVKVIQRQGKVWYGKGVSTASNGQTLQRANTPQSDFLLQRPSGLPVINIKE